MAIQILPGDQRYAQLGAGFGDLLGGLGQALGAGIGSYAGSRGALSVQDIKALDPNISDEEANSLLRIARKDPAFLRQWYKDKQKYSSTPSAPTDEELALVGIKKPQDIAAFRRMPLNQQQTAYKEAFTRNMKRGVWDKVGEGLLNWMGYSPTQEQSDTLPQQQDGSSSARPGITMPGIDTLGNVARRGAGIGVPAAAGFIGTPGNIFQALKGLGQAGAERFIEAIPESVQGVARSISQAPLPFPLSLAQNLPTSDQVKETVKSVLPEGYLEPKSGPEELMQNIAEDIGALMFPLGGAAKGGSIVKELLKKAGIAGAGNLSSLLTKSLGGGEVAQGATKIGTMLLAGMGMDRGLRERASDLYNKAEELAWKKTIDSTPIRNMYMEAEKQISNLGESSPSYKAVRDAITDIDSIAGGNRASLEALQKFKTGMSERINALPDKKSVGKNVLKKMSKDLGNILEDPNITGKEYAQTFKEANKMWSGIKDADKINDKVWSILKRSTRYSPLLLFLNPQRMATIGSTAAAAYGGLHAFNALKQMATNAPLRNAYVQMLHAATKDNASGVIKSAEKMLKSMQKTSKEKK